MLYVLENSTSTLNLQMQAYFGQLDGFDEGSQWAGHVEEFNKKTQWTIVFFLRQVEKFSQLWVQEVQDSEDNCFLSDRLKSFHKYGFNKKTRSTIVFSQTS